MISISEQRLFTRIIRLTLLRGIVIGIWGSLIGLWVYNVFFLREPIVFPFEGSWGGVFIMLMGAMQVLQGEVTYLSSRFLALPQKRTSVWNSDHFSRHFFRLMGSFFIVIGLASSLWKPLKLPNPSVSDAQSTPVVMLMSFIFLGVFLFIGGISWYLALRDQRRAIQ